MVIVQSPMALIFFSVSFVLAICCHKVRRYTILSFVGGLFTSVGIIFSLIAGASMQEILIVVLIILVVSVFTNNKWKGWNDEL